MHPSGEPPRARQRSSLNIIRTNPSLRYRLGQRDHSSSSTHFGKPGTSTTNLSVWTYLVGTIGIITLLCIPTVLPRRVFSGTPTIHFGKIGNRMSSTTTPSTPQQYQLLAKTKLSPDSYLLQYKIEGRPLLGWKPEIPTCIKVEYPHGTDKKTGLPKVLSKSYSPVSHPNSIGTFDLIVKSYPLEPGGGVGKYVCDMEVGDSITATLKKDRIMHGSPLVEGRWNHVGLIAGGTGIAPLLQLARILLDSPLEGDKGIRIHLLFINRHQDDILGRSIIDQMAQDHPNQFFVTYALTGDDDDDGHDHGQYESGRGTVELAQKALPPPSSPATMIFVCGKDGFVAHWGGPVVRGPPKADGGKGPKLQGPLEGVLAEAGYTEEQVFKY